MLFLVLRPDDEDDTPDTTAAAQTTTPETTTEEATTEEATTEETTTEEAPTTTEAGPPPPHRVVVVVRNAQPVGGVKHIPIAQGEQVDASSSAPTSRTRCTSTATTWPPRSRRGSLPASASARTTSASSRLELEERGVPIAELVVS